MIRVLDTGAHYRRELDAFNELCLAERRRACSPVSRQSARANCAKEPFLLVHALT